MAGWTRYERLCMIGATGSIGASVFTAYQCIATILGESDDHPRRAIQNHPDRGLITNAMNNTYSAPQVRAFGFAEDVRLKSRAAPRDEFNPRGFYPCD